MKPEAIIVSTSVADRADAERIALTMVAKRLAACVQITGPVESTFRWNDAIETSQEWICSAKTTVELFEAIQAAIRDLHSYEEPEIIATPIVASSPGYLSWLRDAVHDDVRTSHE